MPSVLVLGATGYIGAPFVTALRRTYPTIEITAYIRSSTHDDELRRLDVKIVRGTLEETEKLVNECLKHDTVVDLADSGNPSITEAALQGMRAEPHRKATLLHLSGAGNFTDGGITGNLNDKGKYWSDLDKNDIKAINSHMKNGAADEMILKAAANGDIDAYIVCPVAVHGRGQSEITTTSLVVFVNGMIANISKLGYSPYVGNGTGVFGQVHVDDVVALMLLVFEKALHPDPSEDAYQRYYIAAGVEYDHKSLASMFAEAMHRNGKINSPKPKQGALEDAGFMARILGANFLVKDGNAKALGYVPKGPSFSDTLKNLRFD